MPKISEMTILVVFGYFQGIEAYFESEGEISNFNKMFYVVYNFH